MRLFRKICYICQNCVFSDNKKGKRIKKWYYSKEQLTLEGVLTRTKWHIFCKRKKRLVAWNKYKLCFIPENWVIKHHLRCNRNAVLNKTECIIKDILAKKGIGEYL